MVAAPQPAWASLPYAAAVKDYLSLDVEPGCSLCHESKIGGDDTATRPFGETVQDFGAIGNDVGSLLHALQYMDSYNDVDGDGDTVHDLDELRQGYDPNNAMNHPELPPPDMGEGGDGATDDDGASSDSATLNDATSGSGGTTSLDPSGAGGTRSSRPPPTRSNTIPEMKSGCAVMPGNSADGAGTLLWFLAGLVAVMRDGRRRSRRASVYF